MVRSQVRWPQPTWVRSTKILGIEAPDESSGAVEWRLVYQRATAKLVLYGFLYLQINGLRSNGAIDTPFKTKVLLRRLKRHRGFGTPLLAL
jgi:hypothetical protein